MNANDSSYTLDRIFRIGITCGIIACLLWLLNHLSDVLIPFAIAFLFAYLMHPLVCLVQKRIPNRAVSTFLVISAIFISATAVGVAVIPLLKSELSHMGNLLKSFAEDKDVIQRITQILPPDVIESVKTKISKENLIELMQKEKFWILLQAALKKIAPKALDVIWGAASFFMGIVGLFIIGLYLVFLLLDYEKVKAEWKNLLPERIRVRVLAFVNDFDASMNRYFRAQALIAGCMGLIFAIGFSLIGLPMGIFLGMSIGLLNMVPYLQIIGLLPASLLALMKALETGTSFWYLAGLVVLVFVVAQAIQDVILTPKVMGKLTGLSPAMILLSISIWGKLLGFFGLVIAIPMTCLTLAYYQRFLDSSDVAAS